MFAPQCISGQPEPPSKETCQSALDDCEPVIISSGLEFPDDFDCDALPGNSETEEEGTVDDRVLGEFICFRGQLDIPKGHNSKWVLFCRVLSQRVRVF